MQQLCELAIERHGFLAAHRPAGFVDQCIGEVVMRMGDRGLDGIGMLDNYLPGAEPGRSDVSSPSMNARARAD